MSSVFTRLVATLARGGGVDAMGQTVPAIRNEVPYETLAQTDTCSENLFEKWFAAQATRLFRPATYVFSARSAAVLGSSNVSILNTPELFQVSPAPNPAAPEDGRTPLNKYPATRRTERERQFEPMGTAFSQRCLRQSRSAGRRPGRAGRPMPLAFSFSFFLNRTRLC